MNSAPCPCNRKAPRSKAGAAPSVALLLLCSLLAGCFPMGLPEPFADSPQTNTAAKDPALRVASLSAEPPRVLLLHGEDALLPHGEAAKGKRRTLGHQFLLGIFPFTRLYLEHGEQSFLTEVMIETFANLGYEVVTAERSDGVDVARAFSPDLILDAELKEFSIDAFDAIFFRILSVSGVARLTLLDRTGLKPRTVHEVNFEQTRYRRFGHAPALSSLAVRSFEEALQEAIGNERFQSLSRKGARLEPAPSEPVLVLSLPLLSEELAENIARALPASYGFPGPAFSAAQVARIIQRGLARGLQSEGLINVAVSSRSYRPGVEVSITQTTEVPIWYLLPEVHAVVSELERDAGEQKLLLRISFKLLDTVHDARLLEQRYCGTEEPLIDADGFRVVTLEQAASRLAKRFINHHSLPEDDPVRCIPERSYLEAVDESF